MFIVFSNEDWGIILQQHVNNSEFLNDYAVHHAQRVLFSSFSPRGSLVAVCYDFLPEELNNLNSENVKSAEKTSVARSARACTGTACPERELKHGKGKTNVLPVNETRIAMKGTSRVDSSVLQPSSLSLSPEEWEKRAIEIIQQQKLRRIAMEKKKADQKNMLKASKSEGVGPPMGSIAMEKKNGKQKTMLKSAKSKDVDPHSESIAMERKKTKHKVILKSSKSEDDNPLIENIDMEKKKTNQKILLKSNKADDVDILTGRSIITCSSSAISKEEDKAEKDIKYHQMRKRLGCEARCEPLIQYLSNMGFKEAHLVRIYDRRRLALHIKVEAIQKRLDFFVGMGVKSEDLVKIITRQPKILEYTIDGKIKPHFEFLLGLGVPASQLGRILSAAPSLLSYSVELSLKPKVRFLTEEVGIDRKKLGKVVVLSPQILIQRVEDSMKSRLGFLSEELGASKESLVKMVTKHPQLLRYSIKDGIKPRIEFLRSIGMSNADIVKVLTRLTQILSLSVEKSLRPKYLYLIKELKNGVKSLTANPAYFSLSLEQRIWARHRFLTALKKVPSGPFPLTALLVKDDSFCKQWANSSLEEYEAFRKELILSKLKRQLLKKYDAHL